jgi:hypothetical protein
MSGQSHGKLAISIAAPRKRRMPAFPFDVVDFALTQEEGGPRVGPGATIQVSPTPLQAAATNTIAPRDVMV